MKVIFLDIDGVLNSRESDVHCAMTNGDLMRPSPKLVIRLLSILQQTGAVVVLTTSWRLDPTIVWPFPVFDRTPRLQPVDGRHGTRGDEIRAWLFEHRYEFSEDGSINHKDFVILDDEPDAGQYHDDTGQVTYWPDRFLQTDPSVGLSADDAAQVVGLFT